MTKKSSAKGSSKAVFQFESAALAAGVPHVAGKGAVGAAYRPQVIVDKGHSFTASIDIDTHFEATEPGSPRWDYGLGINKNNVEFAFWIEPHPASSTGEVESMLKKLNV